MASRWRRFDLTAPSCRPTAGVLTGDRAYLHITCPPTAFDAEEHILSVHWEDESLAPLERTLRSEYLAHIEIEEDRLRGWITDRLRPDTPVVLTVTCGDRRLYTVAELPAPTSGVDCQPAPSGGFDVRLPPLAAGTIPEWAIVTVAETHHQPVGPVLRGGCLATVVAVASAAAQALGSSPAARLFGAALLPALVRSVKESPLPAAFILRGTQTHPRPRAPMVDIIVPAYRDVGKTLACLAESAVRAWRTSSRSSTPSRVRSTCRRWPSTENSTTQ